MKLSDICKYRNEKIELKYINESEYVSTDNMLPNFAGIGELKSFPNVTRVSKFCKNDILLSNIRPYFKKMIISDNNSGCSSDVLVIETTSKDVNPKFLYYRLKLDDFFDYVILTSKGTKMPRGDKIAIMNFELEVPNLEIQKKVVKIIDNIDKKIKFNNKINNNLLEQIKSIYKEIFIQFDDYKRLDEISNVTIGKTPPRSEHECFTTDKKNIKWISISDLGKSGMFIFDTSEKLTKEAVEKYNVRVIPKDTVILSFKLTVGRTAFTTEEMTTNEAIAHFNLNNKELNNYLYCYLTYFNYSDLGSTSSIATAINSKIVKSIKIGIPSEEQLNKFNKLTSSMFELVKNNEKENIKLSELRDKLLPKLMNGEIDLDNIEI